MRTRTLALATLLAALTAPAASALTGHARTAATGLPPAPLATILHTECPNGGGSCYLPATNTIHLAPGAGRFARWHELGHAYDALHLTDANRLNLQRLMHAPAGAWRTPYGPSEWFADYYAECHIGVDWQHGTWTASYADQPTRRRYRTVCHAISASHA